MLSLEHNPAVDYKVFLDMQVNLVANDPAFDGQATVGYWGTYYGDEEMARWSFELMRHYAVEGRRERLSARHGFRYRPELVVNGDFADGLAGWMWRPQPTGRCAPGPWRATARTVRGAGGAARRATPFAC